MFRVVRASILQQRDNVSEDKICAGIIDDEDSIKIVAR